MAADLYLHTQQIMEAAGLPAYEISNHARPGEESRHNLAYWRGTSYLGIGPGAHGRVGNLATRALKSPERWLEAVSQHGHGLEEQEALTPTERMEEKTLMGLRLTQEGLRYDRFTPDEREAFLERTSDGRLDRFLLQQLLQQKDGVLRATPQGQLVLNTLITQLLR